jgi:hypothetical protein
VVGVVAGLVYLEMSLLGYRLATSTAGVIFSDQLAGRVAPALVELCGRARCVAPRVVLSEGSAVPAGLRRDRERVLLVLSASFVDQVDDRQLRAVLAHEVAHLARGDLKWVKVRLRVSLAVGVSVSFALAAFRGARDTAPLYGCSRSPIVCSSVEPTQKERSSPTIRPAWPALCERPTPSQSTPAPACSGLDRGVGCSPRCPGSGRAIRRSLGVLTVSKR